MTCVQNLNNYFNKRLYELVVMFCVKNMLITYKYKCALYIHVRASEKKNYIDHSLLHLPSVKLLRSQKIG